MRETHECCVECMRCGLERVLGVNMHLEVCRWTTRGPFSMSIEPNYDNLFIHILRIKEPIVLITKRVTKQLGQQQQEPKMQWQDQTLRGYV